MSINFEYPGVAWAVLPGPIWTYLGPIWTYLSPIWNLSRPTCTYFGCARARFLKTLIFPTYFNDYGVTVQLFWSLSGTYLGPIWVLSGPIWDLSGIYLGTISTYLIIPCELCVGYVGYVRVVCG